MPTHIQALALIIWLIPTGYWLYKMLREIKRFDFNILWFFIPFIGLFAMLVYLTCREKGE